MRTLGIVTTPPGHRADLVLETALGRPLLTYTAQAVLSSYRLSRAVLCTQTARVADAAEELGFELQAATAEEADLPGLVGMLEADEPHPYDAVMLLPAIHPLRTRDDIDGAIALLQRTGASTVATFTQRRGASRLARIDAEGRVIDETDQPQRTFLRDGSITCGRRALLAENGTLMGPDCRAWLLPPERSCAVEDDFDRFLLEQLLRYPGRPAA